MSKKIIFNVIAREKLKNGIDTLCDCVKVSLGPKGRNVIIENSYGSPQITKDGVTIAKSITPIKDPIENIGAQLVKDVASKTADSAGDGTTTATVLAQSIVNTGLKNLAAGANPMDLKRGMDKAVKVVLKSLQDQTRDIGDNAEIEQIATISANNDSEIGKLIAEAMSKVKKEGVITIEEAKGIETSVKIVEGMQFDKGYISPYFVTDQDKMEVVYDNPYILITDYKVSMMKDVLPLLEKVVQTGKPLIFIADDVDGEVLATLVVNKIRGGLKVAAVRAPGFGDRRKAMLQDIAILTGGEYISEEKGFKLEGCDIPDLGIAEKVIIDKDSTTIVNGYGKKEQIEYRVKQIKTELESSTSEYDIQKLEERLAKLSGGVAVIYVGAASEVEMKERKDRFDDALHATKAAVEEGIIPGGGVAYIRAIKELENMRGENEDETTGIQIIMRALEEPLRQIVENSGKEGSVIVRDVKNGEGDYGYNARTEKFEKLFESGVIDPKKVARVALENASSIAGMLLTTEAVIVEEKEEKDCNCGVPPRPEYGM